MKKLLVVIALIAASLALAGDDFLVTLSSANSTTPACTAKLAPGKNYAVQCKLTACYARASASSTGTDLATTSVLIAAGVLYDTPTTGSQPYVCVLSTNASAAVGDVFIRRTKDE